MKQLQTTFLLFFSLFLIHITCLAEPFTLDRSNAHKIDSKHTKRVHELIIHVPQSYHSNKESYPVVFLLDGYWDFALLRGISEVLQSDNAIPDVIIVGLSYPKGTDIGPLRGPDLYPFSQPNTPEKASVSSQNFSAFIREEAIPFTIKNYRSDANSLTLAGHSLAGLFVLHTLKHTPEVFNNYIALSPAVIAGEIRLDSQTEKLRAPQKRLYLGYGEEEYAPYKASINKYTEYLKSIAAERMTIKVQQLSGLKHSSVKIHGYSRGLQWALEEITPIKASGLEIGMRGMESAEK